MNSDGERIMVRTMLAILCLGVAASTNAAQTSPAAGESGDKKAELNEGRKILQKTAAALEKVKQVRYQAQYQGTGWVKQYVADVEGTAMLGEPSEYDIARFRCEVKLTPPKSEETVELTAGCDGNLFYLIDPKAKTAYVDMDDAVLGTQARNVQRVLIREFVAKEPLADDLKVEKVDLKGTTKVGDEDCHQVEVTQSEERKVVWFVSIKDSLPRRVDRVYTREGEVGTTQLVLTNLAAETQLRPAPFKVIVPEGYTQTDEFAP